MARQEIASTFGDGLMMDLNPINTPKSVLTDCLNGTYITYNGNEFVLQNDMGNYKLQNCKLPTNFIPVGVKGYADILYIVSYNPFTREVEIGSYPAPQSIFTTGDSEELLADEDDLTPFKWGPETEIQETEVEYPDIIKKNKKPIFIFSGGTDEDTYKLNPGDEFKFTGSVDIPTFIYQHLNFYIIDEDNKLYDIDDTQIYNENGTLVSKDLRKVFWETPGWLAAQYDLYVPDRFNLNLRSLNVPEFLTTQSNNETSQAEGKPLDELEPDKGYFKVSMDLSSQTIITDKLFQTELDEKFNHSVENTPWEKNPANTYDHLYIRYLIKRNIDPPNEGEDDYGIFKGIVVSIDDIHTQDYTDGVTEEDYVYYDIPVWKHNYQDDIITAYNNVRPIWFCKNLDKKDDSEDLDIANYHGVVELTAYPIIKYNDLTLKYTQFSTTQRFPLNALKNSSDITIADQIYKWSVDDDSCTISFDIDGPFINTNSITGRYEIRKFKLDKEGNVSIEQTDKTTEDWVISDSIPNLVLYGQNTLNISFKDIFKKEGGMYGLSIILYQNNEHLITKKLLLIPSEVFNSFFGTHDSYWNITPQVWIGKYLDFVKINSILCNNFETSDVENRTGSWIDYKWADETEWQPLYYCGNTYQSEGESIDPQDDLATALNKLYNEKFYNSKNNENIPDWESTEPLLTTLQFKLNLSQLIKLSCDINLDIDFLKGNLWNSNNEAIIRFKQGFTYQNIKSIIPINDSFTETNKIELDLSDYEIIFDITVNPNYWKNTYAKDNNKEETFPFYEIRHDARINVSWHGRSNKDDDTRTNGSITINYFNKEQNERMQYKRDILSKEPNFSLIGNSEVATSICNICMADLPYATVTFGVWGNFDGAFIAGRYAIFNDCDVWTWQDYNGIVVINSRGDNLSKSVEGDGILFKAYNLLYENKPVCVYVRKTNNMTLEQFESALWILGLRYFKQTQELVYVQKLQVINTPNLKNSISINQLDLDFTIKTLTCDGFEIVSNNSITSFDDLKQINSEYGYEIESLLDISSPTLTKTIKNFFNIDLESNQTVDIDLSKTYSDYEGELTMWITTNNTDADEKLIEFEERTPGPNLFVANLEEDYYKNIFDDHKNWYDKDVPGGGVDEQNISKINTIAENLKNKLNKRNDGLGLTGTNFQYQNNSTTRTYRCNKQETGDPNDRIQGSAVVDLFFSNMYSE